MECMAYREANVRLAVLQDARAIAEVHVEGSKTTYKGILSEGLLRRLSVEDGVRKWHEALANPDPKFVTLVGCDDHQEVVGFVCGGAERTGRLGCDGELHAIYLLRIAQRQGLGSLLVRRFTSELRSLGFTSMAVWILARNPFRKFYEALGGKVIAKRTIERGSESFEEIAYCWSDWSEFRL